MNLACDTPWHRAQELKSLTIHAEQLRQTLGTVTARIQALVPLVLGQLPDEALSPGSGPEPFLYLDLSPFLPGHPSSLTSAYVRLTGFSGFGLLSNDGGIVIRDEPGIGPFLLGLDRLDGSALYTALKRWVPNPPDHGGAA